MATVTDSTRTTLLKRAAIAWIVCGELLFCGCRAPWRSWRNDEPSLEQLLLHPEPWDAEARLKQESPSRRTGSPPNSDKNYSAENNNDKNFGRSNPYAARSSADSHAGDGPSAGKSEPQWSQAEFDAAYAAAPPHLRGLLKRQWEATQALNSRQPGDRRDTEANADADADASGDERDDAALAHARRPRSSDAPVTYRMSDDESAADRSNREEMDAEQPADGRSSSVRPNVARKSRPAAGDRSEDEGTVTYSLSDTGQEDAAERLADRRAPLEELDPPLTKKPARRIAHAEPIDTGAGDDVLEKASAIADKRKSQQTAVAGDKNPSKQASDRPSASYVTTASAEVKADPAATAAPVAPAVAAGDEELGPAKELGWRDHVREALRELEEESASATETPAEKLHRQATGRMLRLALGELEPALKPIEGLQPHEQEFFRHQFQSLHDAIDPKGNPVLSRRWTLALDSHRKAMSHLAAVSNLEIKNANFCTDVHSYGVVSKFPNPHFKPNQELLLYCELDNFSAEPVKDGYETQLQGSYEIVDASGHRVADMLLPEDADICRNQRRDYFIAYRIYMPQKIEPGRYQLRLTIEDMKGRKFGQTSLDFQIVP